MPLYWDWCHREEQVDGRKRLWLLTEQEGGREAIWALLVETVRSHYDRLDRIADDVARLGYERAAHILRTRMPTVATSRSGDLGEILASELAEEALGFRIPVKRLRFKDGREMALRGDDFLGVLTDEGELQLLKGESKSRLQLAAPAINDGRTALDRDDGRCTPESLLFVADQLLASPDVEDQELGRRLRDEVGLNALPPQRINHMLFTLSGNVPPPSFAADLAAAGANRNQYSVNLHIADHGEFIDLVYSEAIFLGNG
jgi:hypothetical protein